MQQKHSLKAGTVQSRTTGSTREETDMFVDTAVPTYSGSTFRSTMDPGDPPRMVLSLEVQVLSPSYKNLLQRCPREAQSGALSSGLDDL